jgi:hypothetical protein
MIGTHPDNTRLAAYLESIQDIEFQDVRRHLAVCARCRQNVTKLQVAGKAIKLFSLIGVPLPAGEHPDSLVIADYVEGRLLTSDFDEVKQHIAGCGFCTKAALHYASHSAEFKSSGLDGSESEFHQTVPQKVGKTRDHINADRHWFPGWKIPIWLAVPGTVLVTTAIILLLGRFALNDSLDIVTYQEKQEVVFDSTKGIPPGIGFFGSARQRTEPFDGVSIRSENGRDLHFKWPKIKTAQTYRISIYSMGADERTLVAQTAVSNNRDASLLTSSIQPGRRYEWELTGTTIGNGSFLARGGFVVGVKSKF